MAKPALKLVDMGETGRCGAPTGDGSPCERPTQGGELCWQHSDTEEVVVEPPDQLKDTKYGAEEWRKHVRSLSSAGLVDDLSATHWGLLESACEMYEHSRRCQDVVQAKGEVVKGRTGVKKNPAMSYHTKYRKEYRLCLNDFLRALSDVTASSPDDDDDPLADW